MYTVHLDAMLAKIETIILYFSDKVPLEIFALVGGFIEEIVSPIPSPIIMTTVGTIASYRGDGIYYLIWLSILASVGKTIGCVIFYVITDKLEDVFVTKYGKYFGLKQENLEILGKYFDNTWKDDLILIVLRTIPFFPSLPVSVICGAIKLNMNTYIRATFIGDFLRSMIFALIGYLGFEGYHEILARFDKYEDIILYTMAAGILVAVFFLYKFKNKTDFFAILSKKIEQKKK